MEVEVIRGIGAGPEPTPNPIDPSAPLPADTPIPAGRVIEQGVAVSTGGFRVDAMAEWVGKNEWLVAQGKSLLPGAAGVDVGGLFKALAAGAAVGVSFGGVGAAVGAVVAVVVFLLKSGIFSGGAGAWSASGPGVHEWFTAYGQQDFLNYVRSLADGKAPFATVADAARAQLLWWLETYGAVLTGGGAFYSGVQDALYVGAVGGAGAAAQLYKDVGVDWASTKRLRDEMSDQRANGIVCHYKAVETWRLGAEQVTVDDTPNLNVLPSPGDVRAELLGGAAAVGAAFAALRSRA